MKKENYVNEDQKTGVQKNQAESIHEQIDMLAEIIIELLIKENYEDKKELQRTC